MDVSGAGRWTDVAGAPSRRLNGSGPHDVLILGPDQALPDGTGMAVMTVPTRTAWLIGRIAIAPGEELAPVHALQDAVRLTGEAPIARPAPIDGLPPEHVNALSADAFFTRMAGVVSVSDPEALGALTRWAMDRSGRTSQQSLACWRVGR
ncbi:MAG: DUF1254 domain-containing protein [Oceanicaulis sp.]|nr:DUF1254 domain-containing protein [Oceanicaulis sp.]